MSTQNNASNRRKLSNYWIAPKFQTRFIGFMLAVAIVPVGLTVGMISYFLDENYTLLVSMAELDPETTNILQWELNFMVAAIGSSFLLFLLGTVVMGVIFSHRIAGMIYKLRKTIREISEGHETKLYLRDKDEFKELEGEFNEMLIQLKSRSYKDPKADAG